MHTDTKIAALAARRLNIVTAEQLRNVGVSQGQIKHRVSVGTLRRVFRGVYTTTAAPLSFEQLALAAALACGGFVSHRAAAFVWGIVERAPELIDVTVRSSTRPRRKGIVVHRSSLEGQATTKGPIPISRPIRTVVDLAGVVDEVTLSLAVDEALRRKLIAAEPLLRAAESSPRNLKGRRLLHEVARDRAGLGVPESVLETLAVRALQRYGLPEPVRQYETVASGRSVRFDLAYPHRRVAIELDGRASHTRADRWQADHDRDNATELAGWRVLRFTWHDVTERALYVAMTVGEALGLDPSRWRTAR